MSAGTVESALEKPPSAEEWHAELCRRRALAAAALSRRGADVLIVYGCEGHFETFKYFSGYEPVLGDGWLLLFVGDREPRGIVQFGWQTDEARRRSGISRWEAVSEGVESVIRELEPATRRVAIAGTARLPARAWRRLAESTTEAQDFEPDVRELRRRKTELELRSLAAAARISDEALDTARSELRVGITEIELAARLSYLLRRRSGEWAFPPCVMFGADDPSPVRAPTDRPLSFGETVVVDLGASWSGYQADVSRTWLLGDASPQQARAWEVIVAAHAAALGCVQPGVPCRAVAAAAESVVRRAGYTVAHRIGHGIGLATSFEWPSLDQEDSPLDVGMTFCIEPAIYVTGVGKLKLEDDVLVTDGGYELLTHSSRAMRVPLRR